MVQAVEVTVSTAPLSLAAFLEWDSGDDKLYELIEGEPVPMSDPTANHEDVADDICEQIRAHCQERGLPFIPKRSKLISIGDRNGKATARRGDIVVFTAAEWQRLKQLSRSAMAYEAPPLVIEVVSTNWRDDYLTKLAEYESIGVQEYWIVDYAALGGVRYIGHPKQPTLSLYSLDSSLNSNPSEFGSEFGTVQQFRASDCLESKVLADFRIPARELWRSS